MTSIIATVGGLLGSVVQLGLYLAQGVAYVTQDIRAYVGENMVSVGLALQNLSTAVTDLTAWTEGQLAQLPALIQQAIADVLNELDILSALVAQIDKVLAERARQYLYGRLLANPLGVIAEPLELVRKSGGPVSLPDPNPGAPWAALDELVGDIAAIATTPTHAVPIVLNELLSDLGALQTGSVPSVPAVPGDPSDIPGFPSPVLPAGSDPYASDLLTQDDSQYIQTTTTA